VHTTIPTLWSGTNASLVSIFVLHIPQRTGEESPKPIVGQLAKDIQIKHRAPVISIALFDAVSLRKKIFNEKIQLIYGFELQNNVPLDFLSGPSVGPHKVVIASEEQFKLFTLPQLKPVNKFKLTANEGAR